MKKRCISLLLVFVLCLSLMPAALAVLDTGHEVAVRFVVLYVDSSYNLGYNYGASDSTTFICQYPTPHSDTAYSNHTIANSDIKAAANRLGLDSGYEFVGWTKTASKNPPVYTFSTFGSTACNKGDTIYLVAKRTAPPTVTYTLSYNANGGTGAPSAQSESSATGSSTFTISSSRPVNGDKIFLGWSKNDKASAADYQSGGSITISENTTLYAVWRDPDPLIYSLAVVTNPAGGATSGSGNYEANKQVSIAASAPVAPAQKVYVFTGWTSSNGGSFANANRESTTFTMPSGAVTVTANYTLKDDVNNNGTPDDEEQYDIRYESGTRDTVRNMPENVYDVREGSLQSRSSRTPVRKGWIFDGWTTDDVVVDRNGKFTMPAKDVTFTATWVRDENNNGIPDSQEKHYHILYEDRRRRQSCKYALQ